ncbi:3-octaprenyl-4-hydroxybenzoate carboxy-lyase [Dirofilaria immitis]
MIKLITIKLFLIRQCSQSIKTGKKLDSETLIIFAKNIGHFPIYTSDTTTKRYNEFYSLIPSTSNNAVNPSKEESITGSIHKSLPLKNNDENRIMEYYCSMIYQRNKKGTKDINNCWIVSRTTLYLMNNWRN